MDFSHTYAMLRRQKASFYVTTFYIFKLYFCQVDTDSTEVSLNLYTVNVCL